ncbi:MAG: BON domain-containing protein [Gammaproteobacteria bacterium]
MRALLVVVTALACSGCWAVAVGGAAAAGYYIGKDDRSPEVIAQDARITSSVKTRLVGDKYVDALQVNVDTYEGVVTLRGQVTNRTARDQAARLAGAVSGVKSVDNRIEVVPPEKTQESE